MNFGISRDPWTVISCIKSDFDPLKDFQSADPRKLASPAESLRHLNSIYRALTRCSMKKQNHMK